MDYERCKLANLSQKAILLIWAALSTSARGESVGPNVDEVIRAHWKNYQRGRPEPVERLILHTIEGDASDAITWFRHPRSQVSAHYIIARSGSLIRMVDEKDMAYHARFNNNNSIGIEHAGYGGLGDFTEETMKTSVLLACHLTLKYNIPVDRNHIQGHQTLKGNFHKPDPGPYWPWEWYLQSIKNCHGKRIRLGLLNSTKLLF